MGEGALIINPFFWFHSKRPLYSLKRHPRTKKPIAKIIHCFGRADKLDRSELTRLCQSIARVCGLEVHDPFATNESKSSVDQVGFPRELKLIHTVTLGTVMTIDALWERLGIGKVLRDIARKKKSSTVFYKRALLAMTANRLWISSMTILIRLKKVSFSIVYG